ncbi:hypothetical protein [Bradyrhizobium guangzhouense]|uniref:Uncharacterized protein n=1 Tax=Bradyrhizobium guangzhouense TaxID=1325095 RepID=A0AAE5WVV9_9BRAD|nr:hypothetical protein [Bradyrhizobium guangzhouense]QAU44069.1 hypothetical protein XH91_00990 [Bradyrhizobium guangzhouense]
MILTVEVHGDGEERHAVVAVVRILGPNKRAGRSDYAVGAVKADACDGGPASSAGCVVVGHDNQQGLWALLEHACAALRKADFTAL